MTNPAFDYLRQFKDVKSSVEDLVLKTLKRKYANITIEDLTNAFDLGLTGEFGKIYSVDSECIIKWVDEYMSKRTDKRSYYDQPLLDKNTKISDRKYPQKADEWIKEVNKSYTAYLKGYSVYNMHPDLYFGLSFNDRIHYSYYYKYLPDAEYRPEDIARAKQTAIAEFFEASKQNGQDKIFYNE